MGTGPSHEVDNGGHLLHQGQRVFLAHPQRTFEPARDKIKENNLMSWYREHTATEG